MLSPLQAAKAPQHSVMRCASACTEGTRASGARLSSCGGVLQHMSPDRVVILMSPEQAIACVLAPCHLSAAPLARRVALPRRRVFLSARAGTGGCAILPQPM